MTPVPCVLHLFVLMLVNPYVYARDASKQSNGHGPVNEIAIQESNMLDHCHGGYFRNIYVKNSLQVHLLNNIHNRLNKIDCTVTYAAMGLRQNLLITFDHLAVFNDKETHGSCVLYIFDGNDDQILITKVNGYYDEGVNINNRKELLKDLNFISQCHALTLMYVGTLAEKCNGFTAILTIIEKPYINGTCEPDYFHCSKDKYCIAEQLQCNGYRNCQDGSDEDECPKIIPQDAGVTNNGIGVGIWLMIALIVVAVFFGIVTLIVCWRKTKTKTTDGCEIEAGILLVYDANHNNNQQYTRTMTTALTYTENCDVGTSGNDGCALVTPVAAQQRDSDTVAGQLLRRDSNTVTPVAGKQKTSDAGIPLVYDAKHFNNQQYTLTMTNALMNTETCDVGTSGNDGRALVTPVAAQQRYSDTVAGELLRRDSNTVTPVAGKQKTSDGESPDKSVHYWRNNTKL